MRKKHGCKDETYGVLLLCGRFSKLRPAQLLKFRHISAKILFSFKNLVKTAIFIDFLIKTFETFLCLWRASTGALAIFQGNTVHALYGHKKDRSNIVSKRSTQIWIYDVFTHTFAQTVDREASTVKFQL